MNIRQLEIFLSVCDSSSITKAAQNLYISQPAISKAIKELEESIGVSLFDRKDNRLILNESGKMFRVKANQLVADFKTLAGFNHQIEKELPLRIGTSLTIARNSLPFALEKFKSKYPDTPLKIYSENVQQIQQKLLDGEIDIAFTEGFESNQIFTKEIISKYTLLLVCAKESPLAKNHKIKRENLLTLPLLLREKGSSLRDSFDEVTHRLGIEVSPILESVNTEVLIQAAKANLGVTILPEPLALPYLEDGSLVSLEIFGHKMETLNYSVTLKGKRLNNIQKEMIACFKEAELPYS
ncbi:LysR family transcriptional regulator [Enterococcus timonensis]|uniref:LysR family transcriptional regulator n=1 Tax=Enterococcus timonensis TaxID=1852364 RepID=UPI0008DB0634|nr:LysR family transcriptional regulator [Enterococcus timonensis]